VDTALDSLAAESLAGWTPIHVASREPTIDWAIVDEPFADPFFEQTVHRAMQHPFNQVFARTTPLDVLDALAERVPALEPAGFVFHMSRCGSTLIAQMLSRLTSAVVLSEPQPLDGILRYSAGGPAGDEAIVRRLRAMVAALSAPCGSDARVFVKFHAWHVLALPLIARAFPKTPWVFVFREPRAVLRSQEKNPGAEFVHGTIDPRLAGIDLAEFARLSPSEYGARTLAAFCSSATTHGGRGRERFVEYDTLPEAVFTRVLPFFGVSPSDDEVRRMGTIAGIDAKGEGEAFDPRGPESAASGEIDRLAERWLDAPYAWLRLLAGGG
jgi:hypothetical protein